MPVFLVLSLSKGEASSQAPRRAILILRQVQDEDGRNGNRAR